jgi:hypothetical protein
MSERDEILSSIGELLNDLDNPFEKMLIIFCVRNKIGVNDIPDYISNQILGACAALQNDLDCFDVAMQIAEMYKNGQSFDAKDLIHKK